MTIPYGRQHVTQADIDAVVEVLRSDWLTQGPMVPRFEQAVADHCQAAWAVAVNSATSGLHIACLSLGLGPEDWVWTSPMTFVASANCARYCGARVDFVDIDPVTYNMSIPALEKKLIDAEQTGKLPKILIPVHLCGQSCDMEAVDALRQRYGFRIIEDASHAIGGSYKNNPVGNCRYGDIAVFSFHPVKIITTGEGGMALTNDPILANRMRRLRSHGVSHQPAEMLSRPEHEIWNYQQLELGYNYRMTDIQAALGLSQLSQLDHFIQRRTEIAHRYDVQLRDLPITLPYRQHDIRSSLHLYPIRVSRERCGKTQRQVYESLKQGGVGVNVHYIPVYRQPYYEQQGFPVGYCPEAERYFQETVTLPIHPTLTEAEQDLVIHALRRLFT
ncbi:UDP-4-amino-4, 6-dideoxy-N-acetyl-beta-L-altrosamine transaminase [Candidatus Magnetaquicoccaceae bacterium FCR-1]|uniref:UDP-4-amino-4, 6-dideoxy-N-acetyl-beta-L-altrosamine transaminase n=1 Tax=Candidatus Magnetaquiglobus chichijimensis TaxID=3141448 RepID=A0ABQ0CBV4_9PROT